MDIIAAVATGRNATAIGIVRISGEGCYALCDRVFRPLNGRPFSSAEPRKMVYGDVTDQDGAVLDRALAVRFPSPGSYTGEDSAELHCHGSPVVLRAVLDALFALGARQALPGEFTRRAFLNGRMDLTQAEAVIDLIDAETAAAAKAAAAQLDGALRRPLERVQEGLLDIASRFYAVVDYPDEDIEDVRPEQVRQALSDAEAELGRLLSTASRGKVLKSGVRAAIIGRPNAGKSSLLNALAGYDRAIVTDIPGTTRDTVEEPVLCGGVLLRLVDTAGLHGTEDAVERLGVARAKAEAERADLLLVVHDSTAGSEEPRSQAERDALIQDGAEYRELLHLAVRSGKPWIAVESKCDLSGVGAFSLGAIGENPNPPAACVCVSSVTGKGLDQLGDAVAALFPAGTAPSGEGLLTDARQEDAVGRALAAVRRARSALEDGLTPDAVLTDAEDALNALGELTGRVAKEEIVDAIFSRFCVGK